jgi:hypothetical protein
MRIDPKNYSLDANERHVILAALACYAATCTRNAKRHVSAAHTEAAQARIDRAEMAAARAQDLLLTFAKDA